MTDDSARPTARGQRHLLRRSTTGRWRAPARAVPSGCWRAFATCRASSAGAAGSAAYPHVLAKRAKAWFFAGIATVSSVGRADRLPDRLLLYDWLGEPLALSATPGPRDLLRVQGQMGRLVRRGRRADAVALQAGRRSERRREPRRGRLHRGVARRPGHAFLRRGSSALVPGTQGPAHPGAPLRRGGGDRLAVLTLGLMVLIPFIT